MLVHHLQIAVSNIHYKEASVPGNTLTSFFYHSLYHQFANHQTDIYGLRIATRMWCYLYLKINLAEGNFFLHMTEEYVNLSRGRDKKNWLLSQFHRRNKKRKTSSSSELNSKEPLLKTRQVTKEKSTVLHLTRS